MVKTIKVRAYLPWWFRAYICAVTWIAYMAGLELDMDLLRKQAKQATRYRDDQ
jgi:hypothetical protein